MATAEGIKAKLQGLIESANAATGNTDADLTAAVNSLILGYGPGKTSGEYIFERLPTMFDCHKNYQGWISTSIFKHEGNYAVVTYLRDSHAGTLYDTVTVFFDGWDISRVEQCTFDGVVGSEMSGSVISAWKYNGIYYCAIGKVIYESADLVTWTTVAGTSVPYSIWGVYNIDGVLYTSFDDAKGYIAESSDGGKTWELISVETTKKRNEACFVKANDTIFCIMGKDWERDSQTDETGIAMLCYKDADGWTQLIDTNIVCNFGNCAAWYAGDYIHVLAKSRRYHLNGGDASALRYYRATVNDAKNGVFEFVQRVDDGDVDGIAKYALDSTTVAVYIDADGTGLIVSPVSSSSGIMRHTYYAINSNPATEMSERHEHEIDKIKAEYALDTQYGKDSPKLQFAQRVENDALQTYKPFGYMSNAGSQTVTDGIIARVIGFAIKGDPESGKGLIDVTLGDVARYSWIGSGRNKGCWYSFGSSSDPYVFRFKADNAGNTSIPFAFSDKPRIVCLDDGVKTLFYFKTKTYGMIKVVPYVIDENYQSNMFTIFANPYAQGNANYGFNYTQLEYYNSYTPEIPTVVAWTDGVPYSITPYTGVKNGRWADLSFDNIYETSGFLNCENAAELKFTATESVGLGNRLWFYDVNKEPVTNGFVEAFTVTADAEKIVSVPSGAVYALFTTSINKMQNVTVTPYATATS